MSTQEQIHEMLFRNVLLIHYQTFPEPTPCGKKAPANPTSVKKYVTGKECKKAVR